MSGLAASTIKTLIDSRTATRSALFDLSSDPLTYGQLAQQIETTVVALNRFGIGRGDSVAFVLPNGPLAASAFLSIACASTCAPLNPAYRLDEYEFYLSDLDARGLIVEQAAIHQQRQRLRN